MRMPARLNAPPARGQEKMDAGEYAGLFEQEERMWWFVGMRRLVDDLVRSRAPAHAQCLDAGCGAGFNALDMPVRFGWHVFPCDYSAEALRFSARRGVPRLAGADISALPYADASFDVVTCFDVLVMCGPERIGQALCEFHRVLRPGGLLIARSAALESLRGKHSELNAEARRYTLKEFRTHFTDAGFAVERATYANALLAPLAFVKRRILEPLRLAEAGSDVRRVSPWLDRTLLAVMEAERKMIAMGWRPPFGSSVIAIGRKERKN